MKIYALAAVAASVMAAPAAAQNQNTTTNITSIPNAPFLNIGANTSGTTFYRDTASNNTGTATITASPISADGSLHLTGDRARVRNIMTGQNIAANTLVDLTADYAVINATNQSPAFRVYVTGADRRSNELIWEQAYNLATPGTVNAGDLFWRQIVGQGYDGTTGVGSGSYKLLTLAEWGDLLGGSVTGIGVGQGGGAGAAFDAYADNLRLTTETGTRTYNFTTGVAAAVPEPGTWAMMLVGFGAIGASMRRRRRSVSATARLA